MLSLNGMSCKVVAALGVEAGSTIASSKPASTTQQVLSQPGLLSETWPQNRNGKKDEDVMQWQNALVMCSPSPPSPEQHKAKKNVTTFNSCTKGTTKCK